jgi:NAD(P)H dehydrogenase (quinone)
VTAMSEREQPRIVVTGASGNVGGMIAAQLAREGVPQTLLVRDAARAPDLPGADVVVADFTDPASLRAALRPGDRIFMVSVHEDVATRIAAHRSFVATAAEVGAGLIAYLGIVKPSPEALFHHGRSHHATEQMLAASGAPYAFLRMNLFLDDLPLWFDPDGVCRGPGGDGRVSLITRADTAAVSAAVVKGPGYEGEALDLTGEQSHSLSELAALCSELLGRELRYEPGTREAWLAGRIAAGVPDWDAGIGVGSYDALADGEFDVTSDVVRRVTGTPAESVRAWVAAHPERFDALGTDARKARKPR